MKYLKNEYPEAYEIWKATIVAEPNKKRADHQFRVWLSNQKNKFAKETFDKNKFNKWIKDKFYN